MNTKILTIDNPFEPFDAKIHDNLADKGDSVRSIVDKLVGHGEEFAMPTICILNGEPVKRDDWNRELTDDDVLTFVTLAGDPVTIIIAVVVTIISVAVTLLLAPQIPGDPGDSDPAYSLKGQSNRVRLGEPIEVGYGRRVAFPSYAARPYNQYINNEQFQYSLFCIGQGYYEIEEIAIEDTPISNFDDVETQIVPPDGNLTLFPDNVITSVEVAGIDLLGTNEDDRPTDGWYGGFVANPAGTQASLLQIDIVFSNGLYRLKKGSYRTQTVSYEIQYREIDDDGNAVDTWISNPANQFSVSRATRTPQRFTHEIDVPLGRYEVRARRTNITSDNPSVSNTVTWESLRAFIPSTRNYGNVTLLATKIKASNQINNNTRSRIRVTSTRMLRTWDGTDWTARIATRSPAWALADILQAQYGGRITDEFLRLGEFLTEANAQETRGDSFDFTFDRRSTVWEAAKQCMRVTRSIPILYGSQVGIVRDGRKTAVQAVFTKDNIVRGSFSWDMSLVDNEDHDHVVVEYTNPDDGVAEEVVCRYPDDEASYPENIKMLGISNRDQAFREGMFLRGQRKFQRETVSFRTGLEGMIPAWGDLVRIVYDVPSWGYGGFVVGYDPADANGFKLTLSDPVGLNREQGVNARTNYIAFRGSDGAQIGGLLELDPLAFTQVPESEGSTDLVTDSRVVYLTEALPAEIVVVLNLTNPNREPTYFVVGVANNVGKIMKVSNITPVGNEEVEIECVTYTDKVYSYDDTAAPEKEQVTLPPKIPTAPTVTGLTVSIIPNNNLFVNVSWTPAAGARSYRLEQSETGDAGTYVPVTETNETNYFLEVSAGNLFLRVAGVGETVGAYTTWDGQVGVPAAVPPAPTLMADTQATWEGLTVSANWEPYPIAGTVGYDFLVYDSNDLTLGNHIRLKDVDELTTASYSADEMDLDLGENNTIRDITLAVNAGNPAGDSDEARIQLVNAAPDKITSGLSSSFSNNTATHAVYDITWTYTAPADFKEYQVHGSATSGFTPTAATLLATTSVTSASVNVPLTAPPASTHDAFHWRVVAIDRFGNDVTVAANVNFSDEQTISAKA